MQISSMQVLLLFFNEIMKITKIELLPPKQMRSCITTVWHSKAACFAHSNWHCWLAIGFTFLDVLTFFNLKRYFWRVMKREKRNNKFLGKWQFDIFQIFTYRTEFPHFTDLFTVTFVCHRLNCVTHKNSIALKRNPVQLKPFVSFGYTHVCGFKLINFVHWNNNTCESVHRGC